MSKRGYLCLLNGLIESWRTAHRSNLTWTIIQLPGVQGTAFSNDTFSNDGEYEGWAAMQLAHGEAVGADPLGLTFLNPIPDQGHGGLHVSSVWTTVDLMSGCSHVFVCAFPSVALTPTALFIAARDCSTATRSTSPGAL